jgi:hypothetical protein
MKSSKQTVCSILLLFMATNLIAQEKNALSFSAGASIPVGAFKSSAIVQGAAPGATGTGFYSDALFQTTIRKSSFKAGGLLGFNTNNFTNTVLAKYQKNKPAFQWSEETAGWLTFVAMPGCSFGTAVNKNISFNAGLFAGVAVVGSPSYAVTGVSSAVGFEANARESMERVWAVTFTSRLTAGLEIAVNKKTKLGLQAGYNYLKPTFDKVVQNYYENSGRIGSPERAITVARSQYSFEQNMSTVNIGARVLIAL